MNYFNGELELLRKIARKAHWVYESRKAFEGPTRINWHSEMQEAFARRDHDRNEEELERLANSWKEKFDNE